LRIGQSAELKEDEVGQSTMASDSPKEKSSAIRPYITSRFTNLIGEHPDKRDYSGLAGRVRDSESNAQKSGTSSDVLKPVEGIKVAIGVRIGSTAKKWGYDFVQTARAEHTIASAIMPAAEDVFGSNLHDEQIIHIFWSTLFAELFMIFMLSQNENDAFRPIQLAYIGSITALACAVLAKIMKEIFRFGNRKRRRESMFDRAYRARAQKRHREKMDRQMKAALEGESQPPAPVTWNSLLRGRKTAAMLSCDVSADSSVSSEVRKMQIEAAQREEAMARLKVVVRKWKANKELKAKREAEEREAAAAKLKEFAAAKNEAQTYAERRRIERAEAKELRQQAKKKSDDESVVALHSVNRRRRDLADDALHRSKTSPSPPPSPPLAGAGVIPMATESDSACADACTTTPDEAPAATAPAESGIAQGACADAHTTPQPSAEVPTATAPAESVIAQGVCVDSQATGGEAAHERVRAMVSYESAAQQSDGNALKASMSSSGSGSRSGKVIARAMQKATTAARAVTLSRKKMKASVEEEGRKRRAALVPFGKRYILFRWTICWILNLGIFAALWLSNYIFGATFGPLMFGSIMFAWLWAIVTTWIIVEPSEVLALIMTRRFAKNTATVNARERLQHFTTMLQNRSLTTNVRTKLQDWRTELKRRGLIRGL